MLQDREGESEKGEGIRMEHDKKICWTVTGTAGASTCNPVAPQSADCGSS